MQPSRQQTQTLVTLQPLPTRFHCGNAARHCLQKVLTDHGQLFAMRTLLPCLLWALLPDVTCRQCADTTTNTPRHAEHR